MVNLKNKTFWTASILKFLFCILCQRFITCYTCNDNYFETVNFQICPEHCAECSLLYSCLQCENTVSGSLCRSMCRIGCDMLLIPNGTMLKYCYTDKDDKDCCISCPPFRVCSECVQISGVPCLRCKNNSYGGLTNCDKTCGNCLPNKEHEVICDTDTGQCQNGCLDGFYGQRCDIECNQNCFDSKTNSTKCARDTGKCTFGCIAGRYNEICQSICSNNCLDEHCDQTSGTCRECLPGWYGDTCERKCSEMCDNRVCDQTTGSCLNGCIRGRFGEHCEGVCSQSCMNNTCHQMTGHCEHGCLNGWYGKTCNTPCSHTCFNRTCNQVLEHCENGCIPGNYGNFCNKKCSNTCMRKTCDRRNGECYLGCDVGWFGPICNTSCSKTCVDTSCNQITGVCDKGCVSGYFGDNCERNCSEGLLGKTCENYTVPCLSCESDNGNVTVKLNKSESTRKVSVESVVMFGLVGLMVLLLCFILMYFIRRRVLLCRNPHYVDGMVMSKINVKKESPIYDEIEDIYNDTVSGGTCTTDLNSISSNLLRRHKTDEQSEENSTISQVDDTVYSEVYPGLSSVILGPNKHSPTHSLGDYETPISRSQINIDLICKTEPHGNHIENFNQAKPAQNKLLSSVYNRNDPEHGDSVLYIHAVN